MTEDRDVLTCRARDDWFCSVEQHEEVVARLERDLAEARAALETIRHFISAHTEESDDLFKIWEMAGAQPT